LPPGPPRDLVDLFRLLRNRSPLTIGQLAVRTGLTAGHLSEVLRGWKAPSPGSAVVIARALGADDATMARARLLAESLAELNRYLRARDRGSGRPSERTAPGAARPRGPGAAPDPPRRDSARQAAARRPAQLRRTLPAAQFVGRVAELGQLDEVLKGMAAGDTLGSAAIAVIHGMAGIGKTQLGLFWAHRHRAEFPDGQLFADLHGFEPGGEPAAASSVLRSLVRDLGLPAHLAGESADELVSQFRSLTEGRRLLVFLDNVRDAAQVEPLIPAGENCLVLVTSRNVLADLEGGQRIGLGLLGVPDAMSLLAAAVGAEFIEAAPGRVGQLVEATGRLTLALQVAAWRIAARHSLQRERELDRVLAELAGEISPMTALDGASSQARQLTAVLTGSYRALPAEARRLFRAFAAHPGAEFSGAVAGALAGPDARDPERALDTIVAVHLAEPVAADRYRLHDLVRAFVRQFAGDDADYRAASGRICSWYVHSARNADEELRPRRIRPGLPSLAGGVSPLGFADWPAAFGWLESERDNLAALVGHGVRDGHGAVVWPLPLDMWGYLTQTRRWEQWVIPHQQAADAAAAAGYPSGQGWLLNNLGTAYRHLGAPDAARDAFAAGLAVRQGIGDLHGEADSLKDMALAARLAGDLAEGIRLSEAALAVMSRLEVADLSGTASSLDNIGAALTALGRLDEAAEARQRALRLWDDIGGVRDERGSARCIAGLAEIAWLRQDGAGAESLYLRSLSTFEAIADHWGQADTLRALGEVTAQAAPARARDYWERARACLEALGADEAEEEVAALLATFSRAAGRRSGGAVRSAQPDDNGR
jgi:tetratricopeptide (TPR) repeat protein/transcriptional regulator with XRE-family HTH domain